MTVSVTRRVTLAASALLLALGIALSASAGSAQAAKFVLLPKLHDSRYCEIFLTDITGEGGAEIRVYNTVGLNAGCPAEAWNAIDWHPFGPNPNAIVSDSIAAEQDVSIAIQNGPRRWWLDAIGGKRPPKPVVLGGIKMREVASLSLPSLSLAPFTEITIKRDTRWIFRKGRKLGELTSPSGNRYAIQAYAAEEPKTLSALDPRLASNAGIPEGWSYRTYRAKKRMVLTARGSAVIVRDEAKTVYQRYTPPRWAR